MRRTPPAVGLALGLALLTGCAPSERGSAGATPPPAVPGITAEVVQLRTDAAVGGRVHVRIAADGTAPFTVTGVALDSPGFTPVPSAALTAEFAPGRVIDLPVVHGEAICPADADSDADADADAVDAAAAVARLAVARPGGIREELVVPLEAEVLVRIHRSECTVRALAGTVAITVTGLREDGDALAGELLLIRRGGDEPVHVVRVARSVLVDVAVDGLPLLMAGDRTAASISFTPATCDPHVLSEAKQPYRFALSVSVGGAEPVAADLPLDDTARALLAALVDRVCAGRG